jgi:hypothetical protein
VRPAAVLVIVYIYRNFSSIVLLVIIAVVALERGSSSNCAGSIAGVLLVSCVSTKRRRCSVPRCLTSLYDLSEGSAAIILSVCLAAVVRSDCSDDSACTFPAKPCS